MSDHSDVEESSDDEIIEKKPNVKVTKIAKKVAKPKTPLQLEQFKVVQEKRLESLKKTNKEKKMKKLLALQEELKDEVTEEPKPKPKSKPKKPVIPESDDESSDEEVTRVVIQKNKKKKKPKKIIVEMSSGESDSESESEVEPTPRQVDRSKSDQMKSQKHKKTNKVIPAPTQQRQQPTHGIVFM